MKTKEHFKIDILKIRYLRIKSTNNTLKSFMEISNIDVLFSQEILKQFFKKFHF